METLHTAFAKFLRAEGGPDEARAESRLFDACLDAGMQFDEPCVADWAANTVTADLVAA